MPDAPKKRVAAYCRVSTDEEEQKSSFELQVEHYTKSIGTHEDWVLAGIFADKGISGTQIKHREQFMKMIEDCKAGKIDMIITKSISRFARNVVDCLSTIRTLKALNPPIGIFFEKENLDSLDEKSDVFLTMLASFAQEESRSISSNIRWAIRNRMKEGTQKIPTNALYGYDTDDDGNMVVIEGEAEVIQTIYRKFVQGIHPADIAESLNDEGIFSNSKWHLFLSLKKSEREICASFSCERSICSDSTKYLSVFCQVSFSMVIAIRPKKAAFRAKNGDKQDFD